jgi:hypothetical protein
MSHQVMIFLTAFLGLLSPLQEAHAYLDPGTGSLLFQSLIAAIAAAGAALSLCWGRIRGLLGKGREAGASAEQKDDERANS